MLINGDLNQLLQESIDKHFDLGVCAKILDAESRVLLVRRAGADTSPSAWEMPGGGVDSGENLIQAVKREAKEETGLNAATEPRYAGGFDFHNIEKGITKRKFCFEFVGSGKVTLSPDHNEYRFFTLSEIKKLSSDKSAGEYVFKDHKDLLT